MKMRIISLLSIYIFMASLPLFGGPPDSVNWNLIWRDEFDGDTLNTDNWTMGQEWDQESCDYPEVQMVNGKDLVEVSNGTLKMKSWKEESGGKPYVGSLVKTRQSGSNPPLFTLHYGYVEVKMRRNVVGEGFHMNAYTFSYDENSLAGSSMGGHVWPSEIDFAETLSREFYRDRILNALHNTGPDEEYWVTGIDWSEWVIYGFDWKEDGYVDFYINNELVHSSEVPLVPDLPQYLLLRIGIGGWTGEPNDQTGYPGIQEVDWIRAYQKAQNVSIFTTSPSSGDVFLPDENISIQTNVEVEQGAVDRVEFFADDLLIGSVSESPYTFLWESPPTGRYAISSTAYDDGDQFRNSEEIFITVGDTSNNLIFNSEFDSQNENWDLNVESTADAVLQIDTDNQLSGMNSGRILISDPGSSTAHLTLNQKLYLDEARKYKLSFQAKAESERTMIVKLHSEEPGNFSNYILKLAELGTEKTNYEYTFQSSKTDYHARLTFSLGNDDADVFIDSVMLNSDFHTSVFLQPEEENLRIFPNPVSDNMSIDLPSGIDPASVEIYDMRGKVFYGRTFHSPESTINIQVESFPAGIYLIQIRREGMIYRKKFCKMKR
jgi:hypothetical protein